MKALRILCIDDKPEEVTPALERVSRGRKDIQITCEPPLPIRQQVTRLRALSNKGELHALIVDLRLDQSAAQGERPVDYKAQQLASDLRTKMAEKSISDFPIVLWSITQKLTRSYDRDVMSHDLFDWVLDKEKLLGKEGETGDLLASLAMGYIAIGQERQNSEFWTKLLSVPSAISLDPRVGESYSSSSKSFPIHVLAQFILKNLVFRSGPLVDFSTLCARLGVTEDSMHDSKLLKLLSATASYRGPFSAAWPRWWWAAVEKWWRASAAGSRPVLSLDASDRVKVMSQAVKLKGLAPAKPILASYSSRFTTICQCLRQPLDPIDGFMLTSAGLEPWHDRLYVSSQVALEPRRHRFAGQLDAKEAERLKTLKATR